MESEFGPYDSEVVSGLVSKDSEVRELEKRIMQVSGADELLALARHRKIHLVDRSSAEHFAERCLQLAPRCHVDPAFFNRIFDALPDTATHIREELQLRKASFVGQ